MRDPEYGRTNRGTGRRPDRCQRPCERPWYKDAVIYQLHVKAFFDSNDDGIGDFRGLTEKLDYIQELGVNTIWLLPFYPSPLRDDGYDVADYHNVHSALRHARTTSSISCARRTAAGCGSSPS